MSSSGISFSSSSNQSLVNLGDLVERGNNPIPAAPPPPQAGVAVVANAVGNNALGQPKLFSAAMVARVLPPKSQVKPISFTPAQTSVCSDVLKPRQNSIHKARFDYLCRKEVSLALAPSMNQGKFIACGAGVGAFLGAGAGAAVGVGVTTAISTAANITSALKSPDFIQWDQKRTRTLANKKIASFILNDEIIKHFVCPITGKLPVIPVREKLIGDNSISNGVTFDDAAIRKWIKDNPGKNPPHCSGPLDPDQLEFDFPYVATVLARIEGLIQTFVLNEPLAKVVNRITEFMKVTVTNSIILHYMYDPAEMIMNPTFLYAIDMTQTFRSTRDQSVTTAVEHLVASASRREIDAVELGEQCTMLRCELIKRKKCVFKDITDLGFWRWLFTRQPIVKRYDLVCASSDEVCLSDTMDVLRAWGREGPKIDFTIDNESDEDKA